MKAKPTTSRVNGVIDESNTDFIGMGAPFAGICLTQKTSQTDFYRYALLELLINNDSCHANTVFVKIPQGYSVNSVGIGSLRSEWGPLLSFSINR